MNAALLGACAAASSRANSKNAQPVCIMPESYYREDKRPIVGMINIREHRDMTVIPDLVNNGVDLRFRSVLAVNELIRNLESLRENMLVLEDNDV